MYRLGTVVLAMWLPLLGCSSDTDKECTVGSEACQCTAGGACDPGLNCASGVCVNLNKKPAGATCESDSECQSEQCKETIVEEQRVKQCAETTTKLDGGTKLDSGSSCLSGHHQENKCSACGPNEYCEPGSSAAGIYCLPKCNTNAECCSPWKCMQNKWSYSYKGTICSIDGF